MAKIVGVDVCADASYHQSSVIENLKSSVAVEVAYAGNNDLSQRLSIGIRIFASTLGTHTDRWPFDLACEIFSRCCCRSHLHGICTIEAENKLARSSLPFLSLADALPFGRDGALDSRRAWPSGVIILMVALIQVIVSRPREQVGGIHGFQRESVRGSITYGSSRT
jgi:hypothetical protein